MSRIKLLPSTKRGLDTVWEDYNQIEVEDSEDERKAKLEQWIAKRIGTELMKAYNQREWKVIVDIPGRMVIIGCDSVCNYKGYHIRMEHRSIEEIIQRAKMAAGEILERHNVSRSKRFDAAALDAFARDARDSIIGPDAAAEPN